MTKWLDALIFLGQIAAVHWLLTSVLLLGIAALLWTQPRASAATRHRVWLASLVVCALLPVGALLVNAGLVPEALRPATMVDLIDSLGSAQPGSGLQASGPRETAGAAASAASIAARGGEANPQPASRTASNALSPDAGRVPDWVPRAIRFDLLLAAWGLLWAGAVAWRMTRLLTAWRRTTRLRALVQPPRPELVAHMRRIAERLRANASAPEPLLGAVSVGEMPEAALAPSSAPFCIGATRPCVVVPATWLETASDRDQEVALLHETAHGLRRDGIALAVQQVAACLLPLHPPAARALRQLDLEREAACDDFVLRTGLSARSYGDSLLRQAESCLRSDLLLTAYLGSPSQLARRLLAMTDSRRSRSHRPQFAPTLAVAVVLGGTAAVSLAAWPAFSRSSEAALPALAGVALEEGHGSHRSSHRRHAHSDHYAGRTVLSADDSSLYPAVRRGDAERVARLLDAGEDVNEVWPGDGSPLMVAAHRGDAEMVELLLRRGADVDLAVGGDGTPLIGAVRSRNLDLVQRLIDAGADIDDAGFGGDGNPLIAASLAGDIATARYLVQQGAAIDIHVPDDDTPLINAAQQGHVDLVRYLLDEGADANLTGDFDRKLQVVRTPLNQAQKGGHDDVVQLLRAAGARG